MKTMLITGAAGFIGHFLVQEFMPDHKVICMVRQSSDLSRLKEIGAADNLVFHDITQPLNHLDFEDIDIILHAGGNPSSASSFDNPISVVHQNVLGTVHMLEFAKAKNVKHFVYYGAGESYGQMPGVIEPSIFPYDCHSPYAASKAAGEEFCAAYAKQFGIKGSAIHIANTFGERSQNSRFPVVVMRKILNDEDIEVLATKGEIGGRRWFHAEEVAQHTRFILENQAEVWGKWNSAGTSFIDNATFARMIAMILGKKPKLKMKELDPNSYTAKMLFNSISPSKFEMLGYVDRSTLEARLQKTVEWYKNNPAWL